MQNNLLKNFSTFREFFLLQVHELAQQVTNFSQKFAQ